MKIALITLFPEMFTALQQGIPRKAQEQGLVNLSYFNPRDYTEDKYRSVDDTPYGGGPGMVMMIEPVRKAISAARKTLPTAPVIYLSPQGHVFNQTQAQTWANCAELILLCGRYEGIDERLVELEVDAEWSVGDYVLSGGELPAMVIIDAVCRLIPGVLGDSESATQDSFSHGLLDYPHYTRPAVYENLAVPGVLLTGDHARIRRWRLGQTLGRTLERRPDLLEKIPLSGEQQTLLDEYKQEKSNAIKSNS